MAFGPLATRLEAEKGKWQAVFKTWGAIRQSWRILHKKDYVDDLAKQLKEIKDLLDTRLLMILRDENSLLIKLVNDEILASKHAHYANIINLQHLKRDLLATAQQYHQASLADTQKKVNTILQSIGTQLDDLAKRSIGLSRSERILSSLCFKEVETREERIDSAETGTYSWAFGSWDVDGHGMQTHLVNWLEREASKPFMITGKPGSGKSTFMKFVARHSETQTALKRWSADRDLIIASFYFWSSGDPMQRSKNGLVRSLLYQILCKDPGMIRKIVPQARWEDASMERHAYKSWTNEDILTAFQLVVKHEIENLNCNFCFFIDGLDEYEGPDLELVRHLGTLSSSRRVKLCLSSRPRNVFLQHFPSSGPCYLELHHHTQDDIKQLVESKFLELDGLMDISPTELVPLQEAVVERSDGVFLWVVLILKELVKGLEPPVTVPELLDRLSMMPPTLDAYFQKILDGLDKRYRRFTARLLLMSNLAIFNMSLPEAYCLWELNQTYEDFLPAARMLEHRARSLPTNWKMEAMTRTRKCCGDLLHVDISGHLEKVHKTVVDFLKVQDVKAHLLTLAEWSDISDLHLNSCRVSILAASYPGLEEPSFIAGSFASHAKLYEILIGQPCTELVHQFDKTLCSSYMRTHSTHWIFDDHEKRHRIFQCPKVLWTPPTALALLTWASSHDLCLFVKEELTKLPQYKVAVVSQFLLHAILLRGSRTTHLTSWNPRSMLSILCTHEASLNITVQYFTPAGSGNGPSDWDMSLKPPPHQIPSEVEFANRADGLTVWELYLRTESGRDEAKNLQLVEALFELGADLNCKLPDSCSNIEEAVLKLVTYGQRIDDHIKKLARIALLRRGYIPEPTIDEKIHSGGEHSEAHDGEEDSDPRYESQSALDELAEKAI